MPTYPVTYAIDNILYSPSSSPYTYTYSPSLSTSSVTSTYYSPTSDVIYSVTSPTYIDPTKPVITSIDYTYSTPLVGVYQDLNVDPYTIKQIVKYFHNLALDKWLFEDLVDIINYFKIDNNGRVDLINSMKDYDPARFQKYSTKDMEKIVDFIEKYFLSERVMKRILSRYVMETGTQWVKLPKSKYFIRQLISQKMMKLIKQAFLEKNKN